MSTNLIISLCIFSFIWISIVLFFLRKGKIPIKYSLVWIGAACILLLVAIAPGFLGFIANHLGFETISNMVAGVMFILLLYITMVLTIVVSKQNNKITTLVQEVSMLKQEIREKESD